MTVLTLYPILVGIALVILPTARALIAPGTKRQDGFAPQTTDAPFLNFQLSNPHALNSLQKRATSETAYTVTIAPDETCGYLSGSAGVPITCEDSATCAWNVPLGIICEGTSSVTIWDKCLNREAALNTDICDDVCTSNIFNLLCTEKSAPYCRTYVYPSDVRDYRCASVSETRVSSVDWTYDGQDDPGFSTTVIYINNSTSSVHPTNPSTSHSASHSTSHSTIHIPPTPTPKPKTPVGAIVGGVIGGLIVVGIVSLGAIYLLRRKRSQNKTEASPPSTQPEPSVPAPTPRPNAASTTKSPLVGSPVMSEWRGSSVIAPDSIISSVPYSELNEAPPNHSDPIHELPGSQSNTDPS